MPQTDIDTQLQEAALDPSLWPGALQSISEMMGAIGGNFLPVTGHLPDFPYSPALGEAAERYLAEGWMFRDERAKGVPKLLKTGIFVDQDVVTPDTMARSAYYREFLEPLKLRWFAGLGFRAADEVWCLALQRTPAQGFFTQGEEHKLLQLQGSLSRAATTASLLGHADADGALDAFESLKSACFLLDRLGRVMRMTEGARALLGKDVLIFNGSLRPVDRTRAEDLSRLIAAALWADITPDHLLLRAIALQRQGKRPLLVQAQPLRGKARGYFGSAKVALIVTDLDRRSSPSKDLLQQAFRLTASEAKLLLALAVSTDLRAAAQGCGLTYETARVYVKSILAKTETRSQSELLTLVVRTAQG